MAKTFSLLSNLNGQEKAKVAPATTTQYQSYNIQLGFEKVKVCIPVDLAEEFESGINERLTEIRTSPALDKFAKQFGGFVQE